MRTSRRSPAQSAKCLSGSLDKGDILIVCLERRRLGQQLSVGFARDSVYRKVARVYELTESRKS